MDKHTGRLASQWFDVRGLPIHARVSVDPMPAASPVVVLVHGIGIASRYFIPMAERLAPFCRTYAIDLPGFERSAKPPWVLTLPELTDALAAWMQAARIERAVLLGNSFGCQIVADFAVRYPERIAAAVLQGPTVDAHARTARQQLWRWVLNSRTEHPSQAVLLQRAYRECGLRRLARTFQECLRDRIEAKLPRVQVPALVVRGGRDVIVPQRWAEEVTRLLANGRLVVIPGVGHTVNYSAPVELVRVVRPFLREVREGLDG